MVAGVGALAEDQLTRVGTQHVHGPGVGHGLQGAVDGREADGVAALPELGVQVLGGAEALGLVEQRGDRTALTRRADPDRPLRRRHRRSLLSGMAHRGLDDTQEVVVDQFVVDLPPPTPCRHDVRGLEDAEVLTDQRLGHAECVDELVDAPRTLPQLQHDPDAQRRGQGPEELAGRGQHGVGRERDGGDIGAVLVEAGHVLRRCRRLRPGSGRRRVASCRRCSFRAPRDGAVAGRDPQYPSRAGRTGYPGSRYPHRRSDSPRENPSVASNASVIDTVVNLCKRRGLVYQSGEIYGGTRSAWDYGPLGVELKDNIKRQWWRTFVTGREDVVGLDSSIILPRQVWEASGHVETCTAPLVECLSCHTRLRQDHLQEAYATKKKLDSPDDAPMGEIACPNCGTRGKWTDPQLFSGLVKTFLGPVDNETGLHYLRPETAQGIFVNYKNVMTTARRKPPFGIGQIGKAFRNEITPGNFIFRTREFEQMEIEFFTKPDEAVAWFDRWVEDCWDW